MNSVRIAIFFVLLMSGCTDLGTNDPNLVRLHFDNSVREAVYRYLFQHYGPVLQQNANAYYLAVLTIIGGDVWSYGNPDVSLLHQFEGYAPPVKLYSDCTFLYQDIVDRKTGAKGILFWVDAEISWVGDDLIEVLGGYDAGSQGLMGYRFSLERSDGQWNVRRKVLVTGGPAE